MSLDDGGQDNERDTRNDKNVGDVKGRPMPAAVMEIEKIDDSANAEPI